MDNTLKSPCPLALSRITRLLFDRAAQADQPIEFEEYLAGCKQRTLDEGFGIPANFAWRVARFAREMQARLQAAKRRTISLPLDPRKGGEIHLPEEAAQLATSEARVVVANIPPPSPRVSSVEHKWGKVFHAANYGASTLMIDSMTKFAEAVAAEKDAQKAYEAAADELPISYKGHPMSWDLETPQSPKK